MKSFTNNPSMYGPSQKQGVDVNTGKEVVKNPTNKRYMPNKGYQKNYQSSYRTSQR